MSELNPIDYKILEFILKKEEASVEELLKKFPNEKFTTEYRLKELSKSEKSSYILEVTKDMYTDQYDSSKYRLTKLGEKTIFDYEIKVNKENKKIWIDKIIFSIIVPCFIAYITAYFSK